MKKRMSRIVFTILFVVLAVAPAAATAESPPWIDVTQPPYGAVGDGIHDCTAAIQKAIDNACERGGGVVLLPQGIYLSTGLVVRHAYVTLAGMGPGVSTIRHSGSNPAVHVVLSAAETSSLHNGFTDLSIEGKNAAGDGILLDDGCPRYRIERVAVSGFSKGCAIRTLGRNHSGHISRVEVRDNLTGISLSDRSQYTDISFSRIHRNTQYGIKLLKCNTINIMSSRIELNGSKTGYASIYAGQVDVLNVMDCQNAIDAKYPGAFLIITGVKSSNGKITLKSRVMNVLGCTSVGNSTKQPCVVLDNAEEVNFVGNRFRGFSGKLFSLPLDKSKVTTLKGITWHSNLVQPG